MTFNPAAIRRQFLIFASSPSPLHYLDNAATAQLPQCVLDALTLHETTQRANVLRGSYPLAEAATHADEIARAAVARFLNAPGGSDEVVFTSGATASPNLVAHARGALPGKGWTSRRKCTPRSIGCFGDPVYSNTICLYGCAYGCA